MLEGSVKMAGRMSTRKIAFNGLMIALVFLATRFISFPGPIPPGYINLGDSMIMLTAILLGSTSAMTAGAIGSALADIAYGAYIFSPITFIVKGLEGLIIALLYHKLLKKLDNRFKMAAAMIAGAIIMVAGYFFSELYILKLFDNTFGWAAASAEFPLNLVQGGISCIVGYLLAFVLQRIKFDRYLQ